MKLVQDIAALEAIYDAAPAEGAVLKVTPRLTGPYAQWIGAARFCILTTVGPAGTDGSPRGDDGPVVRIVDDRTLYLPDWRGNNRVDSLRNIVRDGRVSLLFMVPGSTNVMRVNGHAVLTDDPAVLDTFDRDGRQPRTVIVVTVAEAYPQCARAIIRARLWNGADESAGLPTVGQMMDAIRADFGGAAYDAAWPGRAARTMW
jgi:PPOX class probable FMN-dependent enzyme